MSRLDGPASPSLSVLLQVHANLKATERFRLEKPSDYQIPTIPSIAQATMSLNATSTQLLNPSRNGDSYTALGNLCQGWTTLFMEKNSTISNLNLPWHTLMLFPLVLSLVTWQKTLTPTWLPSPVRELWREKDLHSPCCDGTWKIWVNADPSPLIGTTRKVSAAAAASAGSDFKPFCLPQITLFSYPCTAACKKHPHQVWQRIWWAP